MHDPHEQSILSLTWLSNWIDTNHTLIWTIHISNRSWSTIELITHTTYISCTIFCDHHCQTHLVPSRLRHCHKWCLIHCTIVCHSGANREREGCIQFGVNAGFKAIRTWWSSGTINSLTSPQVAQSMASCHNNTTPYNTWGELKPLIVLLDKPRSWMSCIILYRLLNDKQLHET